MHVIYPKLKLTVCASLLVQFLYKSIWLLVTLSLVLHQALQSFLDLVIAFLIVADASLCQFLLHSNLGVVDDDVAVVGNDDMRLVVDHDGVGHRIWGCHVQ